MFFFDPIGKPRGRAYPPRHKMCFRKVERVSQPSLSEVLLSNTDAPAYWRYMGDTHHVVSSRCTPREGVGDTVR